MSSTTTIPTSPSSPMTAKEASALRKRVESAIANLNPVDLEKCIKLGFDPNGYIHQHGGEDRPALLVAASSGSWHCVEVLLREGADPKRAVTSTGSTPLRFAAVRGHLAGARLLLVAGDDPNATGVDKRTPMHMAAQNGFAYLLEAMEKKGGNLLALDGEGNTPLHLSIQKFQALEWLARRAPAALNIRNEHQKTPLIAAIDMRLDKSAMALLEHDQDLGLTRHDGKSALELARAYGLNDVAERIQSLQDAKRSHEAIAAIRAMAGPKAGSSLRP